jgi:hypothetical protein
VSIEIIPNRKSIDDKFPVLGFTVKTGGLPYYEVVITTKKELFAPAMASNRNSQNFYSSRQENNLLLQTNSNDSVYIVPASVLNGFAQTKPTDIFFTLIAYNSADGSGGICSSNIESLHYDAPSVTVAQSFTGQTLSKGLGVSVDSLRRLTYSSATSYQPAMFGSAVNESDEGEAEDGFSMMKALGNSEKENYAEDGYEYHQNSHSSAQYYDEDNDVNEYSEQSFGDSDYEDGFENELGSLAQMQESIFPKGASEPEELYDEDRYVQNDESFSSYQDDYSAEPFSATSSQNYEYAGASAGISQNGYSHKTGGNGYSNQNYSDEFAFEANEFDNDYAEDYGSSLDDNKSGSGIPIIGGIVDKVTDGIKSGVSAVTKIIAKKNIIDIVAKFESGGDPTKAFKAINADTEFAKLTNHEAYKKYHIGLSYGIVQFTQDGGGLGSLLKMMRNRDKAKFNEIFGASSDDLITVTNTTGAFSKDVYAANPKGNGRSNRVQPVGGADIWVSPWKERFILAGDYPPFQAAQNELAATGYLDPIIQFCNWLGLNTDRGFAMVYDRSVQMGVGGAKKWVIGAVGPISTDTLRTKALAALGKTDVADFQRSMGLKTDGWGPVTHAAMVSELRKLGAKSPIPIPTASQMLDSMVRVSAGRDFEHRVKGLRNSTEFTDTILAL